jgi:hypothetical protein
VVDHDGIQIYFVGHLDGALLEPPSVRHYFFVFFHLFSFPPSMWMISLGADHPHPPISPLYPDFSPSVTDRRNIGCCGLGNITKTGTIGFLTPLGNQKKMSNRVS